MNYTKPCLASQPRSRARLIDCVTQKHGRARTQPGHARTLLRITGIFAAILGLALPGRAQHRYEETDLVSDVPGLAAVTDAHLVNPWGLSRSATSFWWTANNGTGTSTLYSGSGATQSLIVTVPPAEGQPPPSTPTGTVFNATTDFEVGPGQPARFLFATQEGTIAGWNPAANATTAITKVDNSDEAIYLGLALGQANGTNYLYAADFHGGKIDVFDRTFTPVDLGVDAFVDPRLPPGYGPFNVQAVGDQIVVTYAKQDDEQIDEVAGAGLGRVTIYDMSGKLIRRLQTGPWMNAPWGVALAPADFGRYGKMLLVGQFGSGKIVAFDPDNGHYRGTLRDAKHRALRIEGLWAIAFGNGGNSGPANTLYFAAGIEDEAHGLFGKIAPLPDRGNAVNDPNEDKVDDTTNPTVEPVTPENPDVTPPTPGIPPSSPAVTPSNPSVTPSNPPVTTPDTPPTTAPTTTTPTITTPTDTSTTATPTVTPMTPIP
jgi:uncharacterized protein (TIGR03118 family)